MSESTNPNKDNSLNIDQSQTEIKSVLYDIPSIIDGIQIISDSSQEALGAKFVQFWKVNSEDSSMYLYYENPFERDESDGPISIYSHKIHAQAAVNKEPVFIIVPSGEENLNLSAIPVILDEKVEGVFVYFREGKGYSEEEKEFFQFVQENTATFLFLRKNFSQYYPLFFAQASSKENVNLMSLLKDKQNEIDKIVQALSFGVVEVDFYETIRKWNPVMEALTGILAEEIVGKNLYEFAKLNPFGGNEIIALLKEKNLEDNNRRNIVSRSNLSIPVNVQRIPIETEIGFAYSYYYLFFNLLGERLRDEQIRHSMLYDSLTGLPNRNMYSEAVVQELTVAKNSVGLFYISIDRFDELLASFLGSDPIVMEFAARLKNIIDGKGKVFHIDRNLFSVIVSNVEDISVYTELANLIKINFNRITKLLGKNIPLTVSIGVSVFPDDGTDPQILRSRGKTALGVAVSEGGQKVVFYNTEIQEMATRGLNIESRIIEGLQKNLFYMVYQPQIDINTGEITGAEVLTRYFNKETGEVISPIDFIEIAERNESLSQQLGEYIITKALSEFGDLKKKGIKHISINISPTQLRKGYRIDEYILQQLSLFKINPEEISLEITEQVLVEDFEYTASILRNLKDKGIKIAVDDFGVANANFGTFLRYPTELIDVVKMDKLFVENLVGEKRTKEICNLIIKFAHTMGMKVVAEGVETEEQLKILKRLGCDVIQGYVRNGIPKRKEDF